MAGRWQVASMAARSEAPKGRAWPRPRSLAVRRGSRGAPGRFAHRPGSACLRASRGSTPRLPPSRRSRKRAPRRAARRGRRPGCVVELAPVEPSVEPQGDVEVIPTDTEINGNLTVKGSVSVNGDLHVRGKLTVNGRPVVVKD